MIKRIKYKITPEIRKQINTDSDIEDYARKHRISLRDFELALDLYDVIGTPCEGCEHISFRNDMYPCIICSRGKKDFYSNIDK